MGGSSLGVGSGSKPAIVVSAPARTLDEGQPRRTHGAKAARAKTPMRHACGARSRLLIMRQTGTRRAQGSGGRQRLAAWAQPPSRLPALLQDVVRACRSSGSREHGLPHIGEERRKRRSGGWRAGDGPRLHSRLPALLQGCPADAANLPSPTLNRTTRLPCALRPARALHEDRATQPPMRCGAAATRCVPTCSSHLRTRLASAVRV